MEPFLVCLRDNLSFLNPRSTKHEARDHHPHAGLSSLRYHDRDLQNLSSMKSSDRS
ncbi:hypothetical protein SISSUDRAFT_1052872 [Sistotremastrum suecicum HHB10207 ss-3]|uniref:Uncharacterized protein n=1 Tax=Sistotremastrum suecicum HHB10207 ss-3 TaxID=1314776 RepID=A0A165ZK11_9AGAM|nr:hypothetical protein SISSUDRAFT_1052872 [Sistotremastrum suecicum HHB10207 ss-3]